MERQIGFPPVYDEQSELLILGSFPSVMSRAQGFYYGNPRNAFWRVVCGFFGEGIPEDIAGKKNFLLRRHIALWDIVASCEIVGSRDETIAGEALVSLDEILTKAPVRAIFCNGGTAYRLFEKQVGKNSSAHKIARKLTSTSPRTAAKYNVEEEWHAALFSVFSPFSSKSDG